MTILADFRSQYPQYDDMSDTQLADSLYQKHYSDIPRNEFDSKIGYNQPSMVSAALEDVANAPITKFINAAGAGVGTGISNVINQATNSNTFSPNALAEESMSQMPKTAEAGKFVGSVAPAVVAIGLTGGALAPVLGTGVINAVVANGLVGSVLAGGDIKNRLYGGVIGAGAGAAASAIGGVFNYLRSASSVGTKVKQVVQEASKNIKGSPANVVAQSQANMWNMANSVENKMFDAFRNTPGKVDGGYVAGQAARFLSEYGDDLAPAQRRVIEDLISDSAKATNLGSLHDVRKALAFNFNKFQKDTVPSSIYTAFKNLASSLDDTLNNNANALGAGEQFKAANRFYKDTILPLIDSGAKDTANLLAGAEKAPMSASKVTDALLSTYLNPNKPKAAQAFLNTLDDVGKKAVEVESINQALKKATLNTGSVDYLVLRKALNEYQTKIPNLYSPEIKTMLKGLTNYIDEATNIAGMELDLARVSAGTKITTTLVGAGALAHQAGLAPAAGAVLGLAAISKLINTPTGQSLLIKMGSDAGKAIGKAVVQGIMLQGTLNTLGEEQQSNMENDLIGNQ